MRSILAASVVASFLAACADSTDSVTGSNGTQPSADLAHANPAAGDNPSIHVFELRDARGGGGGAKPSGGGGTGIYYHGGPVILTPKVAAIYWGSSPIYSGGPTPGTHGTNNAQDGSVVGDFMRGFGGSSYYGINTTYTDGSGNPLNQSYQYSQYWANNSNVPGNGTSVSDAQILAMIQSGFSSGALTYDANTVYAVFTAGTVNLGGGFGSQYCAYHWYGTVNYQGTKTVRYAAMPYAWAYPSGCSDFVNGRQAPNDAASDAVINVLAHELEEAASDPQGNAWYDRRGYENADKCAWNFGTTYLTGNGGTANLSFGGRDYLLQQNWVNAGSGGCRLAWP